jgi:aminoglycoside 6-adenylyltransferase
MRVGDLSLFSGPISHVQGIDGAVERRSPRRSAEGKMRCMALRHADYVARLVSWGEKVSSVRGIIVLGSVAQVGTEDALSDLDLLIVTTKPRELGRGEWLAEVGPAPVLSWTYRSPVGGPTVRQIVYDGPFVVDVATTSWVQAGLSGAAVAAIARFPPLRGVFPPTVVEQLDAWLQITRRGTHIALDKDGIATRMARSRGGASTRLPLEAEFLNAIQSFFGLVLWQSKQLVRGELWMALATVDQQVKQQLLIMMQWHAVVARRGVTQTSYSGRHIAQWLDPRWSESLPNVWARYDLQEAWTALFATLDLFSAVANDVAAAGRYRYPGAEERQLREWLSERQPQAKRV